MIKVDLFYSYTLCILFKQFLHATPSTNLIVVLSVNNWPGMGFNLWQGIGITFFPPCRHQLTYQPLLKRSSFLHSSVVSALSKSNDRKHATCFRTLFCSIGLSIIVTIPHCLLSFYIVLTSGSASASTLFFFRLFLTDCGLQHVQINFRISVLVF